MCSGMCHYGWCHGMLGKEQKRGNGDLAAAQFWSSPYFSPKKLLWVSYLLPAYWKSPVKQEGLQNRRGTGLLFPSEIFSWERGRVLTGKRKVCNVAGRAFPSALPHSLCLAWSAILSPTCGCLCDFLGKAASLTSAQNTELLEILGAGRHHSPLCFPVAGDG